MKTSISRKGFVLVAVPLLVELVFIYVLFSLLQQSHQQIDREMRAKVAVHKLYSVGMYFTKAATQLLTYCVTTDSIYLRRYEAAIAKCRDLRLELKKYGPELKPFRFKRGESTQDLYQLFARMQDVLESVHSNILSLGSETDLSESPYRVLMMSGNNSHMRLMRLYDESVAANEQISTIFLERQKQTAHELEQLRLRIAYCLGLGVIFNLLLAFAVWKYFSISIVRRLGYVRDNALRLAMGKALDKQLVGSDEIAELDRTFHDVASTLDAMRRNEQALVDNATDTICSIDSEGKFALVNPAVERILGFTQEELLGQRHNNFWVPEETDRMLDFFKTAMDEENATNSVETRVKRKDGKIADMQVSIRWSAQNNSFYCIMHDISARKEAEQFKQQIFHMVSHDLKTPLTTTLGSLEFISEHHKVNQDVDRLVGRATNNLQQMRKLINDFLNIEMLEGGKFPINLQSVSLSKILERANEHVIGIAENRDVTVSIETADMNLLSDDDRLVQVFVNLLSNAIKFSPSGSEVRVRSRVEGDFAIIEVIDCGRGVAERDIEKLFLPFSQLHCDDSRTNKGTGLGLAICKGLVERLGGTIGVESEEGRGSTFWVRIPRSDRSFDQFQDGII